MTENNEATETSLEVNQEVLKPEEKEQEQKNKILEKYMAKKSLKARIGYIVALSISFVVALTFLVLGCVQYSVKPKFLTTNSTATYEIKLNNMSYELDDQDASFSKVQSLYNNAFDMSLLSAIFTGQVGGYLVDESTILFNQNNISNYLGFENYIKVTVSEEQSVLDSNGKVHEPMQGDSDKLTYTTFYIPLVNENKFQDVTIVIPTKGNYIQGGVFRPDSQSVTRIKVNANLYNLTQKITEIFE